MCLVDSLPKTPIDMLALLLNKSLSVKTELSSHSTARVLMPPAKLVPLDNACVVSTLTLRHTLKMPTLPKIKNVRLFRTQHASHRESADRF